MRQFKVEETEQDGPPIRDFELGRLVLNQHVAGALIVEGDYPKVLGWWVGKPSGIQKIRNWANHISRSANGTSWFLDEFFQFHSRNTLSWDDHLWNFLLPTEEIKSGFLPNLLYMNELETSGEARKSFDSRLVRFRPNYVLKPRAGLLRVTGSKVEPKELLIGARKAAEGSEVLIRGDSAEGPDAWVDNFLTEFKTSTSNNTSRVLALLDKAIRLQGARNIILDLTQTNFSKKGAIELFRRLETEGLLGKVFDIEILIAKSSDLVVDIRIDDLFTYHAQNTNLDNLDRTDPRRGDYYDNGWFHRFWQKNYRESGFTTDQIPLNLMARPVVDIIRTWPGKIEAASIPSEKVYSNATSIKLSDTYTELDLANEHPLVLRYRSVEEDSNSPTFAGYYFDVDYLDSLPLGRVAGFTASEVRSLYRDMAVAFLKGSPIGDSFTEKHPCLTRIDYESYFEHLVEKAKQKHELANATFPKVLPTIPRDKQIVWSICDAGNPEIDRLVQATPSLGLISLNNVPVGVVVFMNDGEFQDFQDNFALACTWESLAASGSEYGFQAVNEPKDMKELCFFGFERLDPGLISDGQTNHMPNAATQILNVTTARRKVSEPVRVLS